MILVNVPYLYKMLSRGETRYKVYVYPLQYPHNFSKLILNENFIKNHMFKLNSFSEHILTF